MAAGNTYTPIMTATLSSAVSTYTLSSIPSTYTDLILILSGTVTATGTAGVLMRFNGDTGTNYSAIQFDTTPVASYTESNTSSMNIGVLSGNVQSNAIFHISNYASTNFYKTVVARGNNAAEYVRLATGNWRNTAAINSITLYNPSTTFTVGTTLSLYGILAA